jgi:hypothetical protein
MVPITNMDGAGTRPRPYFDGGVGMADGYMRQMVPAIDNGAGRAHFGYAQCQRDRAPTGCSIDLVANSLDCFRYIAGYFAIPNHSARSVHNNYAATIVY